MLQSFAVNAEEGGGGREREREQCEALSSGDGLVDALLFVNDEERIVAASSALSTKGVMYCRTCHSLCSFG